MAIDDRCERCGAENRAGVRFCEDCGAPLALNCPSCGARASTGKRYCGDCGAALPSGHGVPPATAEAAPDGDLRSVTVLFCDIVGSTALAERLGPERFHDLLEGFLARSADELRRFDATLAARMGDGFMAVVGAPHAYEDHALRGCLASLAIQRRIAEDPPDPDVAVRVRIGVNTGQVMLGDLGGETTAVGDAVNVAARLQATADPGAVLVADATAALAGG